MGPGMMGRVGMMGPGSMGRGMMMRMLFAMMDSDGDGTISLQELQAALIVGALARLPAD